MGSSLFDRIPSSFFPHSFSDLQQGVDRLVGGFLHHATDWKSLAALTAGGMTYRLGKIGSPSQIFSVGAGLTAEVATFEFTHRILASENPNAWKWSGPGGLRQGLFQSFISFGTLKGAGHLVRGENVIAQHLLQDAAVVAGHQISGILDITPRPAGTLAEQFVHAEATNLQIGAGMALGLKLAPGWQVFGRALEGSPPLREQGGGRFHPRGFFDSSRPFAFALQGAPASSLKGPAEPSKNSFNLLMRWKGEGGGERKKEEADLKLLKRKAMKNSFEAIQTLQDLARKEHWPALKILAEAAEKRETAIFALIELAESGNIHAWVKLKNLNMTGYVDRLGWRDPALGRRGDALLYLAGIGNRSALETLVADATWYMERGSLDLLMSLAELGHVDSVRGIGQAAFRNPKAVEALARLSERGNRIAPILLKELDVSHYQSTLAIERMEMIAPLLTLARFDNEAAFVVLSQAAHRHEAAVKALIPLIRQGHGEALSALGGVLLSPNALPAKEAARILRDLSDQGSLRAKELLPSTALVRMVERPPNFLGRLWRLYVRCMGRRWY